MYSANASSIIPCGKDKISSSRTVKKAKDEKAKKISTRSRISELNNSTSHSSIKSKRPKPWAQSREGVCPRLVGDKLSNLAYKG